MLSNWLVAEIESGKVFKSLQKYILRLTKKQGQFQKLGFKMLSNWLVAGIESGKVVKCLGKYIIRSVKKQG